MAKIKLLNVLHEAKEPKDFWSDEHRELMRTNFQKEAEKATKAYDLRKEIDEFIGSEINGKEQRDSFGNTYKIGNINVIKYTPQEKQPDNGIYKERHKFTFNLSVDYRFYGDEVPSTVFTEPIQRLWYLFTGKFYETYNLGDFDFFIGVERITYLIQDFSLALDNGHPITNNLRLIIGDVVPYNTPEGLVKCDENFAEDLRKLYVQFPTKIKQPTYDKEVLDNKYYKILNVLRKGVVQIGGEKNEMIDVTYELSPRKYMWDSSLIKDTMYYYVTPVYDEGVISAGKIKARIDQSLDVSITNPKYQHLTKDLWGAVRTKLIKKFRQFNIDMSIN